MINPKYDPSNYTKYPNLIIYKKDDYQKLDILFGSSLLLIKWKTIGKLSLASRDFSGRIKRTVRTPLGELEPKYFRLNVSTENKPFIQFLNIPDAENQYSLEILNPTGIDKTQLEIWEYNFPLMPLSNPNNDENSLQLQALVDATQSNANAIATLASATAALPNAIVNASSDNDLVDVTEGSISVDSAPVLIRPQNDSRRGLTITNASNNRDIRLWVQDAILPQSTLYSSTGWKVQLNKNGGYFELPDELATSAIYAIANGSGGIINYVESIERI